jgi:hypothetical protein
VYRTPGAWGCSVCRVKPDATAEPEIVARLTARDHVCVVNTNPTNCVDAALRWLR